MGSAWSWRAATCVLVALTALQAQGVSPSASRYPITPAVLESVLLKEESSISAGDIRVPEGLMARGDAPEFAVLSIEPVAGVAGNYWVKIGCRETGDCAPFYVHVSSARPLVCGVRQMRADQVHPTSAIIVHPGDHARLVIHRDRALIEVAVVALESGALGQSIRVATPDYKQSFHGQVVSATRLEGNMWP